MALAKGKPLRSCGRESIYFFGGKEGREEREGKEESSSRSGWTGTGVSAALGAGSRGAGARVGAEPLRSRERVSLPRTSRRRKGLRPEEPTCGSEMYPTQLEMRSKLQFHSWRMRGARD